MMLQNLISITDKSLYMCLCNEKDENSYTRYDFSSNSWGKTELSNRSIITVDQFIRSPVFNELRKCKLKTFSVMRGSATKIEWLKDKKLLCITISTREGSRPIFKCNINIHK